MIRRLSLALILLFSAQASATTLLILGDSLSAGYQMPIEKAWPSLLPNTLKQRGKAVEVINASISGDTSGNGLARLPSLLQQHNPNWVLIELGANDGLRGFPVNIVEKNLTKIIEQIRLSGAKPLLMQIQILPNYGKRYTQSFSNLYPQLAKQQQVPLIPFFLEGVIVKPEWMKPDGLHPKQAAQPWIATFVTKNIVNYLE